QRCAAEADWFGEKISDSLTEEEAGIFIETGLKRSEATLANQNSASVETDIHCEPQQNSPTTGLSDSDCRFWGGSR
ncbi:unnamed protein product, partial [Symbiodinium sp. CCMP2592]